jgi:hypothetical protein
MYKGEFTLAGGGGGRRQNPCCCRSRDDPSLVSISTTCLSILFGHLILIISIAISSEFIPLRFPSFCFRTSSTFIDSTWRKTTHSSIPTSKWQPLLGITHSITRRSFPNISQITMLGAFKVKRGRTIWSPLSRHNSKFGLRKRLARREVSLDFPVFYDATF